MKEMLKKIPSVDLVFNDIQIKEFPLDTNSKLTVIKNTLDQVRQDIFKNKFDDSSSINFIELILNNLFNHKNKLTRVINGTGTIIHTNLGRSVIPKIVLQNIVSSNLGYSNLEYNLKTGKRGDREQFISDALSELVGCEAACIVNNNAAAVFITLNSLLKNKKIIVSRGEMVEIGGSFRIPEIIKHSGVKMVEIGSTNKTHLNDFTNLIEVDEKIRGILKVHTSNYKIEGFTSNVSIDKLSQLKNDNLILIEDQGSGTLIDFSKYTNTEKEETVQNSIKNGADLVLFSGDKLLGGVQAGFILGKKILIDKIKKHQLFRTFRVNKIVLSAVETILNIYKDESRAIKEIPTIRMICEKAVDVEKRVDNFIKRITNKNLKVTKIRTTSTVGGGSMPQSKIESFGIELMVIELGENKIFEYLKSYAIPIISIIKNKKNIIDFKTVLDHDEEILERCLNEWKII